MKKILAENGIELPDDIFPGSTPDHFRKEVKKLFKHRMMFVDKPKSLTICGWLRLFVALLHPEQNPSTLWIVPDPCSPKRSYILAAGKATLRPAVIHLKNSRDQALIKLAANMKRNKAAGLSTSECGWETCKKGLWTSAKSPALWSARNELTKLAADLG